MAGTSPLLPMPRVGYSYAGMGVDDRLLIVYPQSGNSLYTVLAHRLAAACEERSRSVELRPASEVPGLDGRDLARRTVMVIQPAQCFIGIKDRQGLARLISGAKKRIALAAEAVGTVYFDNQVGTPIVFDSFVDLGFVSQKDKLEDFDLPYFFLFNGATEGERRAIEEASPSERTIPWTLVGHNRLARTELAHDLVSGLDPTGVVFLPPSGVVIKRGNGTINGDGLDALLRRTRFYVWTSLHEFDYYESFRFRESLLAGAVPCKIDARADWGASGIPGIFPSAQDFVEHANAEGFEALLRDARDYYLSRGLLADGIEEALGRA